MGAPDIKHLIKDLQNGNLDVFDEIYYATKDNVYYNILSIVKDASLSEDLMQETYLKALEKIHTYTPKSSFQSWITTIARNLAINEYNRRKKEMKIDPSDNEIIFGTVESSSEKELMVREMLQYLDETERDIIIMHILGDMKHREIAEVLGKPIGTITWQYNEIIKKLKSKFESR
jgi:RNA polymerase sigma-70 factor (ECF subfamily)